MGATVHYSASVLADSPLFYWRLAEPVTGAFPIKAFDETGNNNTGSYINLSSGFLFNGTAVVPAHTQTPQTDASIVMSGTSTSGSVKMIAHQHSIGAGTTASFSVEWWTKPKNVSLANNLTLAGNPSITSSWIGASYFAFRMNSDSSGEVGIGFADRFTSTDIPSGSFRTGRSEHLVFTYDSIAQLGSFYKDGRLFAGPKTMAAPVGAWTEFVLGSPNAGNANWHGHFDEVAVYKSVLSSTRVKAHWDAAFSTYQQQIRRDNPKLYWRLGDASGSGPQFRDYSDNSRSGSFFGGTANITFSASSLLFNDLDFAISGNATTYQAHMQFTGSSMEIGGTAVNNTFSVEWWMSPGQVSQGSGNTVGWGIGKFTAGISGTAGEAFCGISGTDLFTPPQLGPGFFQPGKTGYYVFTYDGSVARIYKNGFLAAKPRTMVAPGSWGSVDPFKIAVSGAWLGIYDEVAVYGWTLPDYRIFEHWNQGANLSGSGFAAPTFSTLSGSKSLSAGGDYLVVSGSNFQMGAAVLIKSGTTVASGNFAQTDLTGTTSTFIGFNAPAVPSGTYDVVVLNPDSSVATGSAVLTVVTGSRYESAVISDRPVLYWQLRDVSGSTSAADRSNRKNTGTIGNSGPFLVYATTSLVADRGYGDFAFAEFDPNAPVPFISITPPGFNPAAYPAQPAVGIGGPAGAQAFSVEFWIKQRSNAFPFQPSTTGDSGTPRLGFNHPAFLLNVNNVTNGTTTYGTDAPQAVTASSFLQTRNTTHHVVYVFSASLGSTTGNGKLYRDGVLISTAATQNVPTIWQAFQFLGPVSGVFDEIAVYDYPLTSDQVAIHWGTGMLTNANDLAQPPQSPKEGPSSLRSYEDVSVVPDDGNATPLPHEYNDYIWMITRDLDEAGVAPYLGETLAPFMTPFEGIEGAGLLDVFKNAEFLVINSGAFGGGSGAATDTTPPSLTNFSPAFGNTIASSQIISFDVTDNSGFTRLIILHAGFASLVGTEVIHDGTNFSARNYSNTSNVRTEITGGFHYSILRDGGWPSTLTLFPFAIDLVGNENT